MIRRRRVGTALVLALCGGLAMGACSEDDPGPGVIELVVEGEVPVGGVVVELVGDGILAVQDRPGVTVAMGARSASGAQPRVRVVAIQDVPGPFTLRLDVARAGAPLPTATVIQASASDDTLLPGFQLPSVQLRRVP